ncbi:MAG: hypothetical protein WAV40_00370 [Microgenomates group bacterium]
MARPPEIVPRGKVKSLSPNELILFTILGNATKRLDQNELQALYDATFGTTTQYNEIGTMIHNIRRKKYNIKSIKHRSLKQRSLNHNGYWLPEVAKRWA